MKKSNINTLKRDEFNSKFGFIISCIGSAVGMGNIWMFPYRICQNGGLSFLIPYIIFIILIGFSGVIGEMAFGRAMKTGPIGAFKKAIQMRTNKNWGGILGIIPVVGSFCVAVGYSVVVGWIIKFLYDSFTGTVIHSDPIKNFQSISGDFSSVLWQVIALCITFLILAFGVSSGIEKVNKILMPLFFVLFIILAVIVFFIPGSHDGYAYLFHFDLHTFLLPKTWLFALGQAFFSLSLAGSGTLIYGSYLKNDVDIVYSAKNVALYDTIAAILAAVTIVPATVAFNMTSKAGPSLLFVALPSIFKNIQLGQFFAVLFFTAVLFAAITSLINLFETPIEALESIFKLPRKIAAAITILVAIGIGVFIENINTVGKWMDVLSIYINPLGALIAGILFFWICKKDFAKNQVSLGIKKPLGNWFDPITKYVFIGLTLLVYIFGIIYGGIG